MLKIDRDGILLCELQARTFELSIELSSVSSEIFIRRFMYSQIVKNIDDDSILQSNMQAKDLLDRITEQYGASTYGSVKYAKNEIYWIGYIYRYFSYTYKMPSVQVYRLVKPKELRDVFIPYHTLDPSQAISRILEAKHIPMDDESELKRQYQIFKRVRTSK